ncbi:MAG: flavin reductase family protein [Alphaproteobacteria bacterium]|uniref:Flavin reductase family protein n=1 Tax=Candidatus Nitrobium versatile TaxID=2884831 RepID=A0A953J3E7_9BACT|nr:flavin reductase family protein [Candidatus Nitrobium versatile]
MESALREQDPESLPENPFRLIGSDWMLVTAGTAKSYNTMTASWGGLGVLWDKRVCFCFVRPTRYTYEFMERASHFTLSFFDEKHREALEFCGTRSGRDTDKAAATGLTPVTGIPGTVHFAEARLVFECRKIYFNDIDPEHFIDPGIQDNYLARDYHRLYVGEVIRFLAR